MSRTVKFKRRPKGFASPYHKKTAELFEEGSALDTALQGLEKQITSAGPRSLLPLFASTSLIDKLEHYQTELDYLARSHETNDVVLYKMRALSADVLLALKEDLDERSPDDAKRIRAKITETTDAAVRFRERHLSGIETPKRSFAEAHAAPEDALRDEAVRVVKLKEENVLKFIDEKASDPTSDEGLRNRTELHDTDPTTPAIATLIAQQTTDMRIIRDAATSDAARQNLQKLLLTDHPAPPAPLVLAPGALKTPEQAAADMRQRLADLTTAKARAVAGSPEHTAITAAADQAKKDIEDMQFALRVPDYQAHVNFLKDDIKAAQTAFTAGTINKAEFDVRADAAKARFDAYLETKLTDDIAAHKTRLERLNPQSAADFAAATASHANLLAEQTAARNALPALQATKDAARVAYDSDPNPSLALVKFNALKAAEAALAAGELKFNEANAAVTNAPPRLALVPYGAAYTNISLEQKTAELAELTRLTQTLTAQKTALSTVLDVPASTTLPKPDETLEKKIALYLLLEKSQFIGERADNFKRRGKAYKEKTPEDLTEDDLVRIRAMDMKTALDEAITNIKRKGQFENDVLGFKKEGLPLGDGISVDFQYKQDGRVIPGRYRLFIDTDSPPTQESLGKVRTVLDAIAARKGSNTITINRLPYQRTGWKWVRALKDGLSSAASTLTFGLFKSAKTARHEWALALMKAAKLREPHIKVEFPKDSPFSDLTSKERKALDEDLKKWEDSFQKENKVIPLYEEIGTALSGPAVIDLKSTRERAEAREKALIVAAGGDPADAANLTRINTAGDTAVESAEKMIRRDAELREASTSPLADQLRTKIDNKTLSNLGGAAGTLAEAEKRALDAGERAVQAARSGVAVRAIDAKVTALKTKINADANLSTDEKAQLNAMVDIYRETRMIVEGVSGPSDAKQEELARKHMQMMNGIHTHLAFECRSPALRSMLNTLVEHTHQQDTFLRDMKARLRTNPNVHFGYTRVLPGATLTDKQQLLLNKYESQKVAMDRTRAHLEGKVDFAVNPATVRAGTTLDKEEQKILDAYNAAHTEEVQLRIEIEAIKNSAGTALVRIYDSPATYDSSISDPANAFNPGSAAPASVSADLASYNKLAPLVSANHHMEEYLLTHTGAAVYDNVIEQNALIQDALHELAHAYHSPDYYTDAELSDEEKARRGFEFAAQLAILHNAGDAAWRTNPAATPEIVAMVNAIRAVNTTGNPISPTQAIQYLARNPPFAKSIPGAGAAATIQAFVADLNSASHTALRAVINDPDLATGLAEDAAKVSPATLQSVLTDLLKHGEVPRRIGEGFREKSGGFPYDPSLLTSEDKLNLFLKLKAIDLKNRFTLSIKPSDRTPLAKAKKIQTFYNDLNKDFLKELHRIQRLTPPATYEQQGQLQLAYRQRLKTVLSSLSPEIRNQAIGTLDLAAFDNPTFVPVISDGLNHQLSENIEAINHTDWTKNIVLLDATMSSVSLENIIKDEGIFAAEQAITRMVQNPPNGFNNGREIYEAADDLNNRVDYFKTVYQLGQVPPELRERAIRASTLDDSTKIRLIAAARFNDTPPKANNLTEMLFKLQEQLDPDSPDASRVSALLDVLRRQLALDNEILAVIGNVDPLTILKALQKNKLPPACADNFKQRSLGRQFDFDSRLLVDRKAPLQFMALAKEMEKKYSTETLNNILDRFKWRDLRFPDGHDPADSRPFPTPKNLLAEYQKRSFEKEERNADDSLVIKKAGECSLVDVALPRSKRADVATLPVCPFKNPP